MLQPYGTSPGQRFRIEQWARHLAPAGFSFTFIPFEDASLHAIIHQRGRYVRKASLVLQAFARRLSALKPVRESDVVFLHREAALIGPALIERMIAQCRVPIVFDIDDAIWVRYVSPANRRWSYLKWFGKTASICRLSARVFAGNRYLADYARRYNGNVNTVPCTIDTDEYVPRRFVGSEERHPAVTIGWTGSYSTVQHLDTLRDALIRLRRHERFRLDVIGAPAYRLDGIPVMARAWRAESEARDLHHFDIGVMPLPDDNWSRGKCGLKLLQYMAAGVPAVASPIGVNAEIIDDGVNGFLASTPDEWVEKLGLLVRDAALRQRIGLAGRRTVEERYSARVWVPEVRRMLESAARAA